jgi:hypothetical protein
MIEYWLKQIEFFGAADGSPAIVHSQLSVNVLGVSTNGAQGHHAFTGDFRAVQIGPEKLENFQLTFAQRLYQRLWADYLLYRK